MLVIVCTKYGKTPSGTEWNVIVTVIYRPPNTDTWIFNEKLNAVLNCVNNERKLCYLMGDYNIDILNYDSHSATAEFVDMLYSHAFLPLINRPTRITQNSATIIDNIFTNNIGESECGHNGILVSDISDHFPIFHIWKHTQIAQSDDTYISSRNYSHVNKLSFQQALSEIDWSEMYVLSDTQSVLSLFYSRFIKLFDKHFPRKKIKLQYNTRKPWLTPALKQSIRIKNKLYRKLITIGSSYYECQYKMYRNKLNSLLKCAEKQYIADLLESNKSNLKKTWNIMKHIVNRKKTQKLQEKFKMSDNTITSDKTVIAENFNDFFVNIGNNLAKRIPNVSTPPGRYMGDMISQSLFLDPVTPQEIAEIIKSLKNGAPGYDEINNKILQLSVTPIIGPLSFLCNRSLTEGVFPSELKLANVLPLFKSGESMLFNNYRPVSLLCTLSKVFEKIMYSRLLNFLDYHKILIGNQFGFRKLHSSYMALMLMMDQVTKALDSGECVIGIFLDFSKAFDTVNHSILIDKLYHYGIRGNALEWFRSYLSNRSQYVSYNGVRSSTKSITCGVPQGSILGPLLFLIYINDLYNVCRDSVPILLADDTNLFYKGNKMEDLVKTINGELENISLWLKINKLSLNINKTHFIMFQRGKSTMSIPDIIIDNQPIDKVEKTKFLGVVIDSKLSWKSHICLVAGKLSKSIGMIIKAREYLNRSALLTLYYSFVYPYLTYCNHVWGCTYYTNLKQLFILQKKALRIMCGKRKRDSTENIFSELKILKFTDINAYLTGRFMYKCYTKNVPGIFSDFFQCNSAVHGYSTRQSEHLHVPAV